MINTPSAVDRSLLGSIMLLNDFGIILLITNEPSHFDVSSKNSIYYSFASNAKLSGRPTGRLIFPRKNGHMVFHAAILSYSIGG